MPINPPGNTGMAASIRLAWPESDSGRNETALRTLKWLCVLGN
jgi:hypothetical protein